jgi:hypothetical protein
MQGFCDMTGIWDKVEDSNVKQERKKNLNEEGEHILLKG